MAISLAMSWRVGQYPVEISPTEAPQPMYKKMATANLVDRREPEIVATAPPPGTLSPPADPAPVARKPAQRTPDSPMRHRLQRTTAPAKAQSSQLTHRKAGVKPHSHSHQLARAKPTRTRSEVRREYIAAREQVAALTSEDSGSAYLARQAARQRALRTHLADHGHRKRHASLGTSPILGEDQRRLAARNEQQPGRGDAMGA